MNLNKFSCTIDIVFLFDIPRRITAYIRMSDGMTSLKWPRGYYAVITYYFKFEIYHVLQGTNDCKDEQFNLGTEKLSILKP